MGSCCSSQSDATDDNFHSPGRTLGSNTQAPGQNTASAPSRKPTGPGRTTGSGGGNGPSDPLPPRDAAARAAEVGTSLSPRPRTCFTFLLLMTSRHELGLHQNKDPSARNSERSSRSRRISCWRRVQGGTGRGGRWMEWKRRGGGTEEFDTV